MINDDVLAFFKELLKCYEETHGICEAASSKEITYWRKRFLSTSNLQEDSKRNTIIREGFLARPCEPFVFNKQTPEEMIEEYKKYIV